MVFKMSLALRESTEKSLVILDEFGKGTATVSIYVTMCDSETIAWSKFNKYALGNKYP